jgi:hypothetical protein
MVVLLEQKGDRPAASNGRDLSGRPRAAGSASGDLLQLPLDRPSPREDASIELVEPID